MLSCWKSDPCERATFEEIIPKFEEVSQLFSHTNPAYGDASFIGQRISKLPKGSNDDETDALMLDIKVKEIE